MMMSTASCAMKPPYLPPLRGPLPSDLPSRRIEQTEITKVCTNAENRADNQPQSSRQIAELRGERWPDERSRTGNRGEMMAEQDPLVGGTKSRPSVPGAPRAWRGSDRAPEPSRDKRGVETVGNQVGAGAAITTQVHQRFATFKADGGQP